MPSTTTVLPLLRRLSHVSPIRSARVLSWKPCPARSAFLAPTHARRTYATQRDAKPSASSLLSEALDQKQRAAQDGLRDSVGPIPMSGLIQMSRGGERPKKWSELSAGGKGEHADNHLGRRLLRTETRLQLYALLLAHQISRSSSLVLV
jgi:hypothetical protein